MLVQRRLRGRIIATAGLVVIRRRSLLDETSRRAAPVDVVSERNHAAHDRSIGGHLRVEQRRRRVVTVDVRDRPSGLLRWVLQVNIIVAVGVLVVIHEHARMRMVAVVVDVQRH